MRLSHLPLLALVSVLAVSPILAVWLTEPHSSSAVPATTVAEMADTTVRVRIEVVATLNDQTLKANAYGSGVVYQKSQGLTGPVHSRILTATHVLSFKQGTMIPTFFGPIVIQSATFYIDTADGRSCNLQPLVLGTIDENDTATAEADCDAGRVAVIASESPARGEHVYVSGHPEGVSDTLVTEGHVAGWDSGYMTLACPAWHGNSGGPVFYKGRVVGLLVRGSETYALNTMSTALQPILDRIKETPPMKWK